MLAIRHAWQEEQIQRGKPGSHGHLGGKKKGRYVFDPQGRWEFGGVTYAGDWKIETKTESDVEIKDDCPCWTHTRDARKVARTLRQQKLGGGGSS